MAVPVQPDSTALAALQDPDPDQRRPAGHAVQNPDPQVVTPQAAGQVQEVRASFSILFMVLVLAVFLLVARRRFFACSVSLRSTSLVLPHALLFFCPFQFIRFLSHAALLLFVLVVTFFVSHSFCFCCFALISFYRPLGVFPFGSFIFVFFGFFVIVFLRLCMPGFFFHFFCQFHLPLHSVPVLVSLLRFFYFWPLLLFMAFGISCFCSFGPSWAAHCRFVRARA